MRLTGGLGHLDYIAVPPPQRSDSPRILSQLACHAERRAMCLSRIPILVERGIRTDLEADPSAPFLADRSNWEWLLYPP